MRTHTIGGGIGQRSELAEEPTLRIRALAAVMPDQLPERLSAYDRGDIVHRVEVGMRELGRDLLRWVEDLLELQHGKETLSSVVKQRRERL